MFGIHIVVCAGNDTSAAIVETGTDMEKMMTDTPENKPAVKMTLRKNGSILVEGPVEMFDSEGNALEVREKFALCRCGASKKKPFCDGSHKDCGFDSSPC